MCTKKCSKCGWEYPIEWPGRKCRFCKEPFAESPCSHCGKITKLHNGVCRACETLQHKEWRDGRKETADNRYSEWLKKIRTQSTSTLTEEQWIEACKYFGGCAYCGRPEIDVRSMFIIFKEGGRYCAWNIVPACEKCETARKDSPNPFLRMDHQLNRSPSSSARKYNHTVENLQRIAEYLQGKMEEASESM